jgi:putative transposase
MADYKRLYVGPKWFFTVVTGKRRPIFSDEVARVCLRQAIRECRLHYPFSIDGWVLLPDHIHCIWTIEEPDADFSTRWSIIKRLFTKSFRNGKTPTAPFWQRRFWEHGIRDEKDFENHINYLHYNPVKHGYVTNVRDWKWSSFHKYGAEGLYPADWGSNVVIPDDVGSE